jgi:hypothetical protein
VHPTDLARSDGQIYVTDEGRESAILLTSFGIPVFISPAAVPPPLPDIFLLNGPGFATGLDIRSTRTGSSHEGDELTGRNGNVVEPELFGIFPDQSTSNDVVTLQGGGSTWEEWESGPEESQSGDEAAVIRLMIGLDEAFRARSMDGLQNDPEDEEFEDSSGTLECCEIPTDQALQNRAAREPLSVRTLGDSVRSRMPDASHSSAPARLAIDAASPPHQWEEDGEPHLQVDDLLALPPPVKEGEEIFPIAIDRAAMLVPNRARKDSVLFAAYLLAAFFGLGFRDSCSRSIPLFPSKSVRQDK